MYKPTEGRRKNLKTILNFSLFICIIAVISVILYKLDNTYVIYNGNVYEVGVTSIDLRGTQDIDLKKLYMMPSLRHIDLRNSSLTVEQADEIREKMPDCELLWTVRIAGEQYSSDSTELVLTSPDETDFELLRFFDRLTMVEVKDSELYELIMNYDRQMEDCLFVWSVPIGNEVYKSTTASVTLPEVSASDIDRLQYLPQLISVDFSGCTEYDRIMSFREENPDCYVLWTVDMFGTTVTSEDTELDISGTKISDGEELRSRLRYLPALEKLMVCDCGLSNEVLDEINREFENVKIIWKVYFGRWSLRTDATAFSTQNYDPPAYRLVDREVTVLRYCTDLEMLDLGHNSLTSVEPFTELTNLKVLILADNRISDISSLNKLTKLEYFEMFINRISDISVVQYMPNLTDINFCWNRISDPSPLYNHKHLERVWMCGGGMSAATKREFIAALPGVEFDLYSTYGSTNGSWRNNEHFSKIRDAFRNHNGMNDYHW